MEVLPVRESLDIINIESDNSNNTDIVLANNVINIDTLNTNNNTNSNTNNAIPVQIDLIGQLFKERSEKVTADMKGDGLTCRCTEGKIRNSFGLKICDIVAEKRVYQFDNGVQTSGEADTFSLLKVLNSVESKFVSAKKNLFEVYVPSKRTKKGWMYKWVGVGTLSDYIFYELASVREKLSKTKNMGTKKRKSDTLDNTNKKEEANPPEEEDDELMCKFCYTNESNWVNFPCGHMQLCKPCGEKLKTVGKPCLVCRKMVTISFRVYK